MMLTSQTQLSDAELMQISLEAHPNARCGAGKEKIPRLENASNNSIAQLHKRNALKVLIVNALRENAKNMTGSVITEIIASFIY